MKRLSAVLALLAGLPAVAPARASTVPSPIPAAGPTAAPSPAVSSTPSATATATTSSSPEPCHPYPSASPAPGTVYLGHASRGSTLSLRVGQTVVVQFDCTENRISLPTSSGPALRRTGGSVQPSGRGAQAFFAVVEPGTAVLTAEYVLACAQGPTPCPSARTHWEVTVNVAGEPCAVLALSPGTDWVPPSASTVAGVPAVIDLGTRAATATVSLWRTSPGPVVQVRRQAAAGGRVRFAVVPTVNTVLEARTDEPGCTPLVGRVDVAPRVTLSARRTGPLRYLLSGRVFPAGGQLVSVHRQAVGVAGPRVLTAQARVQPDGTWQVDRRFLGAGSFLLSAGTAAVPGNVAGVSLGVPTTLR